jgi:arylsulfatase A-like enzyme
MFFILAGLFLVFSCKTEKQGEIEKSTPPNVLMIAVDDLNEYLGYLGDPNAITPNIDRLAASGTAFTNAHCQAPLCGPSRASVMTGLRPSTSGIYGMIDDDKIKSGNGPTASVTFLPEYFQQQGYRTLGVGKIFHKYAPSGLFEGPGRFVGEKPDHNFGPVPEERMVWPGHPLGVTNYSGPKTSTDWGAFPEQDSLMPDYKAIQWAIEQLETAPAITPFFMTVGFLRPHVPLHVPQKWFDLYPLEDIVLPPYLADDMNDVPDIAKKKLYELPMMPTTDWAIKTNNWKKIVQAYLACISFVDNEIGKLMTALDESAHADNTIVVFWSDHGYRVGEKGTFAKHSLWEVATQIPLIFKGPDIPKGREIDAPVELLSLYPTLLELCRLPKNTENEGISLVPILKGGATGENYGAITTYGWSNHAIRTADYRYIRFEDGSEELYDVKRDPNEFNNLAGNSNYVKLKDRLKEQLPVMNRPWHEKSSYNFTPYFDEQKERVEKIHSN